LAKEVNTIKKDLEEQKQKTDSIAEWIKNTFRPGMEKMKGTIFRCLFFQVSLVSFSRMTWD
jgi:uncharacterized protein YdhG (YjbR/CyaY superfamily)